MPNPRKIVLSGIPMLITSSIQHGLPLVPTSYLNLILEGILARAQTLYPIEICAYCFLANHFHMVAVVQNPTHLSDFMERFKSESALAINKLMGYERHNVWCDGYDSPLLLTVDDVIEKLVYLYINPTRDNLVNSIEEYPGLNTWKEFLAGGGSRICPRISRRSIQKLTRSRYSMKQQESLAAALAAKATESSELKISPDAWMYHFNILNEQDRRKINKRVYERVTRAENLFKEERKLKRFAVFGPLALKSQPIDKPYIPQRTGRRTYCICSNVSVRIAFLTFVKKLVKAAQEWYQRALQLDYSLDFPLGLFRPSLPSNGNFLPKALLSAW